MPAKWLMSPAGGLMEEYAMIAPTMMSINPKSFSTTVKPMGISALNPEPSRFNFTLSRLILIYLILRIENMIRFNFTKPWKIEHLNEFVSKATTIRDKAIIFCMFQSGLAVQEICDLDYGDIADEFLKTSLAKSKNSAYCASLVTFSVFLCGL
jgi:hypothetical protein